MPRFRNCGPGTDTRRPDMHLNRRTWIQLAIFITVSITAFMFMIFGYMRLPSLLFGVGHYTVAVQLPEAGGLYERANVTYRGTEVGPGQAGPSDRLRRRPGAVAALGREDPVDSAGRGPQHVGGGRAVHRTAAAQWRRATAETRRRPSPRRYHSAARHQRAARRHQPRPAGHPGRQSEN